MWWTDSESGLLRCGAGDDTPRLETDDLRDIIICAPGFGEPGAQQIGITDLQIGDFPL